MGHFLGPHRSARSHPVHSGRPTNFASRGSSSSSISTSSLNLHQFQVQQAAPTVSGASVINNRSIESGQGSLYQPLGENLDASRKMFPPQHLTAEAVAALPPPGLSGPSSLVFSPKYKEHPCGRYLAFVSSSFPRRCVRTPQNNVSMSLTSTSTNTTITATTSTTTTTTTATTTVAATASSERQLYVLDFSQQQPFVPQPLLRLPNKVASKRRMIDDNTTVPANSSSPVVSMSSSSSSASSASSTSLEERIRRERQRIHASTGSLVQFSWCPVTPAGDTTTTHNSILTISQSSTLSSASLPTNPAGTIPTRQMPSHYPMRLLVPVRGSLYIQNGILDQAQPMQLVYDKAERGDAVDPQLSPDGTMIAFCVSGDIYVRPATLSSRSAVRVTYDASPCVSHGLADFIAQEEMDRYRGYWWHPDSSGILFARLDESKVPPYRIIHQDSSAVALASTTTATASVTQDDSNSIGQSAAGSSINNKNNYTINPSTGTAIYSANSSAIAAAYEDHRYPFAGKDNPSVKLGFVSVDRYTIFQEGNHHQTRGSMPVAAVKGSMNGTTSNSVGMNDQAESSRIHLLDSDKVASENWKNVRWFEPPREAPEYLARVSWLPDGSVCAQWQNRSQTTLVLMRIDLQAKKARTLLIERSDVWINLNHMFKTLPRAVHPDDCCGVERDIPPVPNPLPNGSFSFLFASERTGYSHLYLYTYVPGYNGEQAILIRPVFGAMSGRDWIVENIVGIDMKKDIVYFTATYDSVLERHLYALPITNCRAYYFNNGIIAGDETVDHALSSDYGDNHHGVVNPNGVRRGLKQVMNALSGKSSRQRSQDWSNIRPIRLTVESGMHNIIMDDECRLFVDTSSDLNRPTTVKIYELSEDFSTLVATVNGNGSTKLPLSTRGKVRLLLTLYDAMYDDKSLIALADAAATNNSTPVPNTDRIISSLPAPEFLSFPTSDGSETLHAALYRPDPRLHGPGPYPLICAVYGGPHVQRVNKSWSQCADMRAQRLRSLGFCVVKCDNRGSSRRGLAFESAISRRLGRLEVLDQVATVRQLTLRGIADPSRVGIYGWSYGGYLAAMCLCRAPDVFHVAVAGAPVTSWDGYDTHYTERYMGLPSENPTGYREAAVFDHVPNMRGQLMIVHGLIDENVHFRHTARLINRLIASGKDYDLLLFPDERHSPRRLRDRIYMEQRISNYFLRNLGGGNMMSTDGSRYNAPAMRPIAGHL